MSMFMLSWYVAVNEPDKCERVGFVALEHVFPLCFKLEAVLIAAVVPTYNVLVPGGLIANGEVIGIVLIAFDH